LEVGAVCGAGVDGPAQAERMTDRVNTRDHKTTIETFFVIIDLLLMLIEIDICQRKVSQ
jgi:hypothetical protein